VKESAKFMKPEQNSRECQRNEKSDCVKGAFTRPRLCDQAGVRVYVRCTYSTKVCLPMLITLSHDRSCRVVTVVINMSLLRTSSVANERKYRRTPNSL
jgi:hypothetical protein